MIHPFLKLRQHGDYEVTYAVLSWYGEQTEEKAKFFAPYPWIKVKGIIKNHRPAISGDIFTKTSLPLEVLATIDSDYWQAIRALLLAERYDFVQIEHSHMAWLAPLLHQDFPDICLVLDLHNVEHRLLKRWHEWKPEDLDIQARVEKMKHWELTAWQWFDACLTVSLEETEFFEQATKRQIRTQQLPVAGVLMERFAWPPPLVNTKTDIVAYIGTLNWFPNSQGLHWFISEVLPLILEEHRVSLHVTGYGPPDAELLRSIKGMREIVLFGRVEDEIPRFREAKVFVVPLWIAAGARVKILHAWAAGVPVVSTSIGAEGLPYVDGDNVLIADTPQAFADQIVRVLQDGELSSRLSMNGRKLVEATFTADHAAKELHEFLSALKTRRHQAEAQDSKQDGAYAENGDVSSLLTALIEWKTDIDQLLDRITSTGSLKSALRVDANQIRVEGSAFRPGFRGLVALGWRSLQTEGPWRFVMRLAQPWTWIRHLIKT
jgi:glycosyltransferase involved in cell wall biosynthesis